MTRHLWNWTRRTPLLRRRDIVLTILPACVWLFAVYGRPVVIQPRCGNQPEICARQSVPAIDQMAIGLVNQKADDLSFTTQHWSGFLALGLPPVYLAAQVVGAQLSPASLLAAASVDLVLIFQSVVWNGMINESTRLLVQRPRPFVYTDPGRLGADPSNYTSFYSGHTSFSAATGTALVLALARRGARRSLLYLVGSCAGVLIFLTGLFRVLAGRHFPTDVMTGALAGILVSVLIAYWHQKEKTV